MSFMCEANEAANDEIKQKNTSHRGALIFRCDGMKHVCEIVKDSSAYTGGSEIDDAEKRKKKGRNGVVRMGLGCMRLPSFRRRFFHRLWAERRR